MKHRRPLLSFVAIFLLPIVGTAGTYAGPLYDQETLEHWRARYSRSTNRILTQVIAPAIHEEDYRVLDGLVLEFPLRSDAWLDFTVTPSGLRLPVASLKLLDDLCVAAAWLDFTSGDKSALAHFVAAVKSGTAEGPFETMGIAGGQTERPEINEPALRCFNSARAFIIAHGLGHLSGATSEIEADRYALELLQRTGTLPLGVAVLFRTQAILMPKRWERVAAPTLPRQPGHPIDTRRLDAIMRMLKHDQGQAGDALAKDLADIRGYLSDEGRQRAIAARGKPPVTYDR